MRNWGRQIRVLPPPNLASPAYQTACKKEIRRLIPIVLKWQAHLTLEKKHLLIGIKLGHETSIGINSYYLPNGNDLLDKPESDDPQVQLNTDDVTARGMTQIGFAALTASGIDKGGTITEKDLTEVSRRYLEMLCREASACGVPTRLLFAHGAGWKEGERVYDVPVNRYSCPAWSFYRHAFDPSRDSGVQRNLRKSNAPYWAATEWLLMGTEKSEDWWMALTNTFKDPRCRYVCIFNWESIRNRDTILDAVAGLVKGLEPTKINP